MAGHSCHETNRRIIMMHAKAIVSHGKTATIAANENKLTALSLLKPVCLVIKRMD